MKGALLVGVLMIQQPRLPLAVFLIKLYLSSENSQKCCSYDYVNHDGTSFTLILSSD